MHLIASNWILWLATPANWPVVLAVAGGLGFVIFVHELGHFLVAKACGVKCEKFYIGFDFYGLKFCKFQWGETEYGIGIFPLGGYVKMLGQDDNPAQMAEENQRARLRTDAVKPQAVVASATGSAGVGTGHASPLTHGDLPSEPVSESHAVYDPRSYMAQSVPKRMAIISAGVIMNVIFAVIMATVAYALGVPETPCIVGGTVAGGAAWQADLQPGDKITRIANVEDPRFHDLQTGVTLGDVKDGIPFTILRAGDDKLENIRLFPDSSLGVPMIGITSAAQPQLIDRSGFHPTAIFSPARQAKPAFEPGDIIVQIDDTPIHSYRDLDSVLAKNIDQSITVTVKRAVADHGAEQAPADKKSEDVEKFKKLVITVEPTPLRDFGLVMPLGPITAVQRNSPAEQAGLQVGDRILALDGQPVGDPFALEDRLQHLASTGKSVNLQIQRQADEQTGEQNSPVPSKPFTVAISPRVPEFSDMLQTNSPLPLDTLGIACEVPTTVLAVKPNGPAAAADLQPGDEIVSEKLLCPPLHNSPDSADHEEPPPPKTIAFGKLLSWPAFVLEVLPTLDPDTKVQLEVKHGDKTRTVELALSELKNAAGNVMHSPQRGFNLTPMTTTHQAHSLGEAFRLGGAETVDSLLTVFRFLRKIGGQIPVTMLAGPVGIIQEAGYEAQQGLGKFLLFLTFLSANLAIVNFLPIPVLDGGHMVFLIYEGLRGKPASERVIVGFTYAGMIFLLSLMLFVLALDTGLIPRL